MNRNDRRLRNLLRVIGVTGAMAYPCALLPHAWMDTIHQWTGLGELPVAPIVGYLSRSLSFFYGMVSTLLWICSSDIPRFRPIIRAFGGLAILLGGLLLAIDVLGSMPRWWTLVEGPVTILMGASIWLLAGRDVEVR